MLACSSVILLFSTLAQTFNRTIYDRYLFLCCGLLRLSVGSHLQNSYRTSSCSLNIVYRPSHIFKMVANHSCDRRLRWVSVHCRIFEVLMFIWHLMSLRVRLGDSNVKLFRIRRFTPVPIWVQRVSKTKSQECYDVKSTVQIHNLVVLFTFTTLDILTMGQKVCIKLNGSFGMEENERKRQGARLRDSRILQRSSRFTLLTRRDCVISFRKNLASLNIGKDSDCD